MIVRVTGTFPDLVFEYPGDVEMSTTNEVSCVQLPGGKYGVMIRRPGLWDDEPALYQIVTHRKLSRSEAVAVADDVRGKARSDWSDDTRLALTPIKKTSSGPRVVQTDGTTTPPPRRRRA